MAFEDQLVQSMETAHRPALGGSSTGGEFFESVGGVSEGHE